MPLCDLGQATFPPVGLCKLGSQTGQFSGARISWFSEAVRRKQGKEDNPLLSTPGLSRGVVSREVTLLERPWAVLSRARAAHICARAVTLASRPRAPPTASPTPASAALGSCPSSVTRPQHEAPKHLAWPHSHALPRPWPHLLGTPTSPNLSASPHRVLGWTGWGKRLLLSEPSLAGPHVNLTPRTLPARQDRYKGCIWSPAVPGAFLVRGDS